MSLQGQVIHGKVPYSHPHNPIPNLSYSHPYLTMNYMPLQEIKSLWLLKGGGVNLLEHLNKMQNIGTNYFSFFVLFLLAYYVPSVIA